MNLGFGLLYVSSVLLLYTVFKLGVSIAGLTPRSHLPQEQFDHHVHYLKKSEVIGRILFTHYIGPFLSQRLSGAFQNIWGSRRHVALQAAWKEIGEPGCEHIRAILPLNTLVRSRIQAKLRPRSFHPQIWRSE